MAATQLFLIACFLNIPFKKHWLFWGSAILGVIGILFGLASK